MKKEQEAAQVASVIEASLEEAAAAAAEASLKRQRNWRSQQYPPTDVFEIDCLDE